MSDKNRSRKLETIPEPLNASAEEEARPIQTDAEKLKELNEAAAAAPRLEDDKPPPRPTPAPAGICAAVGCGRATPEGERLCPRHSGKGAATADKTDTPEAFRENLARIVKDPPRPVGAADALQGDDVPAEPPRPTSQPTAAAAEPPAADRRGKPKRTGTRKPAPEAPKVDAVELTAELAEAPYGAEALALLARIVYARQHDGADCPPNRLPSAAELDELGEWVGAETQSAIATEVAAILWDDVARALGGDGEPFDAPHLLMLTVDGDLSVGARVGGSPIPTLERLMTPGGAAAGWAVLIKKRGAVAALAVLHDLWCQCPPDRRPRHPLGPVVAAWLRFAPFAVTAEDRADRRIMPALRIVGPTPERERGRLFGGLVDDRTRDAAASLSLFPDMEPERPRVPLLEIVDRAGLPIRSRGRGAPLEARLLVRGGLLMIRPQDRRLATVRIAVTVGEMLDGLWPPGPDGRRHVTQHWPRLLDALHRARDWTVPDADGGRWFPMALRRLPPNGAAGTPALDDLVVIDLAPVPGAVTGATVDLPWLDRMGVESGPKWRAYIAARTLMWRPGKTRRPVPGTNRRRYGWSADPADYPVVPAEDLRRMAFGDGDIGHRTRAAVLAPWESLPDVQIEPATDPRTGVRGYRLRPTDRDE